MEPQLSKEITSSKEFDAHKVQSLYRNSQQAARVLDILAKRSKAQLVTTVPLVEKKTGINTSDVIAVFKKLDEAGAGRFYYGRNAYPSRFAWSQNMLNVARVARTPAEPRRAPPAVSPPTAAATVPEAQKLVASVAVPKQEAASPPVEPPTTEAPAAEAVKSINHVFVLRPGYQVVVKLPTDVTAVEIVRFTDFLTTLPFVN